MSDGNKLLTQIKNLYLKADLPKFQVRHFIYHLAVSQHLSLGLASDVTAQE